MAIDEETSRRGAVRRGILTALVFFLLVAALMFLPAGTGWRRGWLFLLVFLALMTLSGAYLWRRNPDIFVARSRVHKGTKSWDKVLLVLIMGSFLATFAVAAFDARRGCSTVPAWLTVIGYALYFFGAAGATWVCAVNKFAEPSVRIQSERGQKVVQTGPYAIVRHPLYVAGIFECIGIPLALGSYLAFIPVGIGIIVIIVRTVLEDRVLQNELDGYRDYVSRVRYRLIPGIW